MVTWVWLLASAWCITMNKWLLYKENSDTWQPLHWCCQSLLFYSPTVLGGWMEQHSRESRIRTICICVGVSAGPKAFWRIRSSYQQSCRLSRVCSSKTALRPQLPFCWVSWSLPISYTACRRRHYHTSLLIDTLYVQVLTACLKYSGHYFLISLVKTAE